MNKMFEAAAKQTKKKLELMKKVIFERIIHESEKSEMVEKTCEYKKSSSSSVDQK